MADKTKDREKLKLWQDRYSRAENAYQDELIQMDDREEIYRGKHDLKPFRRHQKVRSTVHVRNIASELIEAQVDSTIPQPKVTARRRDDEQLAKIVEDMERNELDRLPMEMLNDLQERIVPIQGGSYYLIEWDNTKRTHDTVGEITVSALHPKQVIPQDGVFDAIENMDYIFLRLPQTKEYIRRRYGVDLDDESESDPDVKTVSESEEADDLVTQKTAYYRNDAGGIGIFSWVNDVVLEDLEDYQARRLRRCRMCGAAEPEPDVVPLDRETQDGSYPEDAAAEPRTPGVCPYCGSREWTDSEEEYEERTTPVVDSYGRIIAAPADVEEVVGVDALGAPIVAHNLIPLRVPYYKPCIYPIILQRNVSAYGRLLGESDIEKIRDQQNTVNRIEEKIIEKLTNSGSYLSLPAQSDIEADDRDMKIIRPGSAADMSMIGVYTMQGDIQQDLSYLEQIYQEARQIIGVTDSFQGRRDTTATSGKAKEFAAAQSAGRLESKRRMKDAAYAGLFEAMFKFILAYADEPRIVVSTDSQGNRVYSQFNRYDFLRRDEAGELYYDDQLLFACDTSAPLAANREAMWQETRQNLQTGAFGNPESPETLILFWSKMEQLHYPGAADTRTYIEEQYRRQQQMQQMQQMQQAAQAQMQQAAQRQRPPAQAAAAPQQQSAGLDRAAAMQILEQARQAAARDAGVRLE